jgi:hypothetical protein
MLILRAVLADLRAEAILQDGPAAKPWTCPSRGLVEYRSA